MPRPTLAHVLLLASAACGGRAIQAAADDGTNRVDATAQAPQLDGAALPRDAADGGALDGSAAAVDGPSNPIPDGSAAAGDAPDDASPTGPLDSSVFVSDAGSCGTGVVTFRLDPGNGPWEYSISGDEEPNWLALFSTSGMPLYTAPSELATLDCSTCLQPWAIPIGYGTADLGDAGTEETWDGLFFAPDDAGTCSKAPGGPYGSGCVTPVCAPPGPYVAFMCACGSGAPASSGLPSSYAYAVAACTNPTCVRVPFEYPSPAVVVGTMGDE